jgi:hypothetical protein
MTAPSPLPSDLIQDPRTPITGAYQGKRIIFAGTYFEFLLFLIEAKTHLHENITPADDTSGLMQIVNECRKRPDAGDVVDFSEEREAIERLQADLGTRFTVSGGEVIELGNNIPADEPSDEAYPF